MVGFFKCANEEQEWGCHQHAEDRACHGKELGWVVLKECCEDNQITVNKWTTIQASYS